MKPQVLYVDGDSWLSHFTSRVLNDANPVFKDLFIINHAVPASSNIDIITRTDRSLQKLRALGIEPWVCVCLSEVGRSPYTEFKLTTSRSTDMSEYLQSTLLSEVRMLSAVVKNYKHYICNGWTRNPVLTNLSLIDFIGADFTGIDPVYSVGNSVYTMLNNTSMFTKESFVAAVDNKQQFQKLLLKNPCISETLHPLWPASKPVYQNFFQHVLTTLNK